jgi:hypothetical protein
VKDISLVESKMYNLNRGWLSVVPFQFALYLMSENMEGIVKLISKGIAVVDGGCGASWEDRGRR